MIQTRMKRKCLLLVFTICFSLLPYGLYVYFLFKSYTIHFQIWKRFLFAQSSDFLPPITILANSLIPD